MEEAADFRGDADLDLGDLSLGIEREEGRGLGESKGGGKVSSSPSMLSSTPLLASGLLEVQDLRSLRRRTLTYSREARQNRRGRKSGCEGLEGEERKQDEAG